MSNGQPLRICGCGASDPVACIVERDRVSAEDVFVPCLCECHDATPGGVGEGGD